MLVILPQLLGTLHSPEEWVSSAVNFLVRLKHILIRSCSKYENWSLHKCTHCLLAGVRYFQAISSQLAFGVYSPIYRRKSCFSFVWNTVLSVIIVTCPTILNWRKSTVPNTCQTETDGQEKACNKKTSVRETAQANGHTRYAQAEHKFSKYLFSNSIESWASWYGSMFGYSARNDEDGIEQKDHFAM